MEWRLAIAVGIEMDPRQAAAELPVVIDLTVGDQCRRPHPQRLVAGNQIDDRQPVVQQCHPTVH